MLFKMKNVDAFDRRVVLERAAAVPHVYLRRKAVQRGGCHQVGIGAEDFHQPQRIAGGDFSQAEVFARLDHREVAGREECAGIIDQGGPGK